jgi:deoxyribodipyrimidine photo-lyase
MATKFKTALVWHRRDLRLSDNPALHHAAREAGQVVPIYVLSTWRMRHRWTGPNRQHFLCGCLASLAKNLEAAGGHLVIREGDPAAVLAALARETGADALYFNRDIDPFGVRKEAEVAAAARSLGLAVLAFQDVVLHGKDEVLTGSGEPYRVFTSYSKNWFSLVKPEPLSRVRRIATPAGIDSLPVPDLGHWAIGRAPAHGLVPPGERAARQRMDQALAAAVPGYHRNRDSPTGQTTSRLSQDLRFGLISVRELDARCRELHSTTGSRNVREGVITFRKELAWREFYMAVLGHFPGVLECEFNPDWRGVPWDDDPGRLERWKHGQTGFPLVDAGMRQLAATGFMHNRLRMVTAMFLTKDLHLHWSEGEAHFMQHLTDGEIASNNGGWQWSAGTGADAAPYFRVQNPWSQTKRYDPEGEYIRSWIPELRDTDPRCFLQPPDNGHPIAKGYPAPMVDHATERARTLERFQRHRPPRG